MTYKSEKEWTWRIFADELLSKERKINNKKEEQQKFAGKYNFQKNNNP